MNAVEPPIVTDNLRLQSALEIVALSVALALVTCCQATMPLWIGAKIQAGSLSTLQVGWVGSAELAAMAVGVLAVALSGQWRQPRGVVASITLVVAAANLVAMISSFLPFIIARSLSGLAVGILWGIVTPMAACRPNGQRVLTIANAGAMLLVSIIYIASTNLISRFGPAGLFAVIAGIAAATVVALVVGWPTERGRSTSAAHASDGHKLPSMIACLGFGVVTLGQGSVFQYIVTIGEGLGVSASAVADVLAIALPLSILATVAAHFIGERIGLIKPLVAGLLLLAVDIAFLRHAGTWMLFFLCSVGLNVFYVFCWIYATALVGQLDLSGRFVNALNFLTIAIGALGPALGGKIIVDFGFRALALAGASCVSVGLSLFLVTAAIMHAKRWGALKTGAIE